MDDLKKSLSDAGFEDVSSYINSGNLFFSSEQSQENCISKIKDLNKMDCYFLLFKKE